MVVEEEEVASILVAEVKVVEEVASILVVVIEVEVTVMVGAVVVVVVRARQMGAKARALVEMGEVVTAK